MIFWEKEKMKYATIFIFVLLMVMMNNSVNAEEVTCQEQELKNVQISMGHPDINPPYTSGHVLVFECTDVNMKMYGQRAIKCQPNGKWDNPYPKCGETKCVANFANMIVEVHSDHEVSYKPGDRLKLACVQGHGLTLQGQNDITCQADGEWSGPFPSCMVETTCGPPPNLSQKNADTSQMLNPKKTEYNLGEKVHYTCFKEFKLEGNPHLTCAKGRWRGNFTCVAPCLASVEEMDQRNIELMNGRRQRLYCPHLDHTTFVCKWGKYWKKGTVESRQQCLYGKMNLPECE